MTLFVIMISSCKLKSYTASYSAISISSLNQDKITWETWETIDTNNIVSNDKIVVLSRFNQTSNKNIAYIESKDYKSNIQNTTNKGVTDKILIDYISKTIYFLNEQISYKCSELSLVGLDTPSATNSYSYEIKKDNESAIITFSKNIPSELRSKLVSSENVFGVSKIESKNQKISLNSFKKNNSINLNTLLKKAKKSCVLQEKEIDLIFI